MVPYLDVVLKFGWRLGTFSGLETKPSLCAEVSLLSATTLVVNGLTMAQKFSVRSKYEV